MKLINNTEYDLFVADLTSKIIASQTQALHAVNKELIALYWNIGKSIVEKQKQHGWGDAVITSLADDIQKSFPGLRGFSTRSLWKMRDLYVSYVDNEKLPPLVAEISWTTQPSPRRLWRIIF